MKRKGGVSRNDSLPLPLLPRRPLRLLLRVAIANTHALIRMIRVRIVGDYNAPDD